MGEVVHALRSELAHQTAEINAMRASGKQLEAELAATRQALDGARGVASARGEVLRRLLRLTGGHEGAVEGRGRRHGPRDTRRSAGL